MKFTLLTLAIALFITAVQSVAVPSVNTTVHETFHISNATAHRRAVGGPQTVMSFSLNGGYQFAVDINQRVWVQVSNQWIDTTSKTGLLGLSIVGYGSNSFAMIEASKGELWIGTISIPAPLSVAISLSQQGGAGIAKVHANPAGSIWVRVQSNVFFRFENRPHVFAQDTQVPQIVDFAVRDLVYVTTPDGRICTRITGHGPYTCMKPSGFTPRLVAVGQSLLYVLDTAGNLQTTKLPLTASSAFFRPGYSAPNARLLSVGQGLAAPFVIRADGGYEGSFCASETACTGTPPPVVPSRFAMQVRGTGVGVNQYYGLTNWGQQFVLWPTQFQANELFTLTPSNQLVIQNGNLCMDVSAWRTNAGAAVVQWPCNAPASANQQFDYQAATGWWVPRHAPGMCLTRNSAGVYGNLVIMPCDANNGAQRFDNIAK
ncbi:hypothetical protein HDU96_007629 [Phlyctochytrium bullatum]|nr:hypothetical protein HDU96_007629 [Phlyctochytrium bullatum]